MNQLWILTTLFAFCSAQNNDYGDLISMISGVPNVVECNFEEGLCPGWSKGNLNSAWSVGSGEENTEVSYDHTLGEIGLGKYAYVEAAKIEARTMAKLVSRPFIWNSELPQVACINVWYHTYGNIVDVILSRVVNDNNVEMVAELKHSEDGVWIKSATEVEKLEDEIQFRVNISITYLASSLKVFKNLIRY